MDKLRPGTSPMAPENVLWFEFVLNPALLDRHLSSPKPDPSPYELISKFLGFEGKADEEREFQTLTFPSTSRDLALKVLAMKVMARLKWNLDGLDSKWVSIGLFFIVSKPVWVKLYCGTMLTQSRLIRIIVNIGSCSWTQLCLEPSLWKPSLYKM